MPRHVGQEMFIQLAAGMLDNDPQLANAAMANPASFLAALRECARLGHMPGTDAYAIVPFRNGGAPGGWEIVGIEQYQGEIERMYRAGQVTTVKCEVVREHDTFAWNPGTMVVPRHEYDALADVADRGELIAVYAYAKFRNGEFSQVIVMAKSEVMLHRAEAKTKKIWDGPFEPAMWRKTAVHELEKWVPSSSEWLVLPPGSVITGEPDSAAPNDIAQSVAPPTTQANALQPNADSPSLPTPARRDWSAFASPAQLGELSNLLEELGHPTKAARLDVCEQIAGRELTGERYPGRSSGNLSRAEAATLIATLASCGGDPANLRALPEMGGDDEQADASDHASDDASAQPH
jgi:recombination protein RecT